MGGYDAEEAEGEGEANQDTGKPAPEWVDSFDTNAMASMMQDQNMQQLLSQMVQSLGGPTSKPHPDDPFIDPGFLGQMFHSQTIQSITFLQEAVGKLSLAPDPSEGAHKPKRKAKAKSKAAAEEPKEDENTPPG